MRGVDRERRKALEQARKIYGLGQAAAPGASGDGSFLFPQPGEDNRLKAFQSVQVPPERADPIRFAEPAGTETLYILVSRSPVPDLDRLLPARGSSRNRNPPTPG